MAKNEREVIGVDDRVPVSRAIPLGIQHMMSMFGSTVLVPVLTGLDPNVAIMCSGIGTICYLLVTRNKIPSYLGSSFAFISPIIAVGATKGLDAAMSGVICAGIVFLIVAGIVKLVGTGWLDRLLPPVLVASVMVVIGVGLSATAANMAFMNGTTFDGTYALVAAITLFAAVMFSTMGGIFGTVPVLLAIVIGYVVAVPFGLVDFSPVVEAAWIGLPSISAPRFDLGAIVIIAPVAIVTVIEHIGHLLAVGEICDRDFRPMLPRSLAGDGLSTIISGFLGGPPTTTYAENIGVMSVTRVYSTQIFWYAGGFALIVGGFCPKISALIRSIPSPVMGGVCLLLFGLIASNGLRMFVTNKVDFDENRNLMIASVVIILGVGMETAGLSIPIGGYTLPGMATSTLVGIILNLVLPGRKEPEEEGAAAAE
ncbi:MAG: NCS2 family nucleobase:cation symporter [Atopobiaceae bacterium]|nr:NCS2 family nucleobase:cation symporter [Atopobiaceae bacterium]MCH4120077.1 NCS2 family nucleobase:cation symporter [Atopobiaceae bacterium]MCI1317881.1 NCS2 family nucleobase:cation symporter [Atopobiaceae bacterium]MCI1388406.1 NCS2 family nucleobase:cation symporter [Atopobiaceae bacterium]MCI1431343.1 NCS2 family nucleobase:cation symporter [Atopobiaceae bacterium]